MKDYCSRETWTSNIFFFDFETISDNRVIVFEIEILLSDWLLAILIPLDVIYLQSHIIPSLKASSLIPFRCINTTVANTEGAVIKSLSLKE